VGPSRADEPLRCAWRNLKQASLKSEPSAYKPAVQSDASPKGALVEASLSRKHEAEQGQSHEQTEHGEDAEIESGVDQAEDHGLGHNRGARPGELRQFSPEPSPEEQFFGESNAEAQSQSIESISGAEFAEPAAPGPEQQRQGDQREKTKGWQQSSNQ